LYDRPEYQILLEKLKFYLKYQDKLQINEFNNLDKDATEFELAMNKLGIKILELETKYVNDMAELEYKFEDMKKVSHLKTVKKLDKLKKIVNDKFNVKLQYNSLFFSFQRLLNLCLGKRQILTVKNRLA